MLNKKLLYFLPLFLMLMIHASKADTTFFENQNDFFIMDDFPSNDTNNSNPSDDFNSNTGGGCNKELEIISDSDIIFNQGEKHSFEVDINNIGSCTLYDINLSLVVPKGWQSTTVLIDKLYQDENWRNKIFNRKNNETVVLSIAPLVSDWGNYNITLKADTLEEHKRKDISVAIMEKPESKIATDEVDENKTEKEGLESNNRAERNPVLNKVEKSTRNKVLQESKSSYSIIKILGIVTVISLLIYQRKYFQKLVNAIR